MSEVTKPIALDESLHTTESTPRNLADVLAEGFSDLADSVKPSASDIPISPISGMSADDVQEGLSELKQSLDDRGTWVELLGSTSTVGTHTLVDSYRNYKSIMIVLFMSGSKIISQVCPSNFLLSAGYKMYVQSGSDACLVSFSDNTTINIESTTQSIRIYGQK